MSTLPLVDPSPLAMTARARVYLTAAGARHFFIGAFMLAMPWLFSAAAFIPLFGILPLPLWALVMTAVGVTAFVAAIGRSAPVARFALAASAVITLVLAAGLTIGVVASWVTWIERVGWDTVLHLLTTRPPVFPRDLLSIALAPPSPFLPLVMLAVTVKDFTMCAQPLRVPLEEYAVRVERAKGA